MSGFEIAGAVLGALPIAIAAFDWYKEVNRRASIWSCIGKEHKRFRRNLEFESNVFELSLKQLLLPLVADEDLIKRLLAKPGGEEWKSPETEEALRNRLGTSYDMYLSIMDDLECVTEELGEELALTNEAVLAELGRHVENKDSRRDRLSRLFTKDSVEFEKFRLKFSVDGGSTAGKLLKSLHDDNERLERLLKQLDKVAQLSQQRQQPVDAAASSAAAISTLDATICTFWKRAAALYHAIQGAWSGCCCSKTHMTRILLQHQTAATKARFEILFCRSAAATGAPSPWDLRRALVTVGEDEQRKSCALASPTFGPGALSRSCTTISINSINTTSTANLTHRPLKSSMRKSTASIDGPGATAVHSVIASMTATATATATIHTPPSPPVTPRKATIAVPDDIITDLCKSLAQTAKDGCAGFLHDDEDCRYYLYPEGAQTSPLLKSISLEQLIRREVGQQPLSYRQCLFLSMTLASAFLQLLDSPWIPNQWTEADIIFFPDPSNPSAFQLDKPHVQDEPSSTPSPSAPVSQHIPTPSEKRHLSLCRLGIVLEELCFRTHIESWRSAMGFQPPRTPLERHAFDLVAGQAWKPRLHDEASGAEYFEAVNWCLGGSHESTANGSSQDAWRKEMLKHVVGPLERSHRQFSMA